MKPIDDFIQILTAAKSLALVWDMNSDDIDWYGDAACVLKLSRQNLPQTGYDLKKIINSQDAVSFCETFATGKSERNFIESEFRIQTASGDTNTLLIKGKIDEEGAFKGVLTNSHKAQEDISFENSGHSFGNRIDITNRVQDDMNLHPENERAVLCFGIDRSQLLNDAYGGKTVDELIVRVGERLSSFFIGERGFYYLGGDKYAAYLPNTSRAAIDNLVVLILNSFQMEPFTTLMGSVRVSVSIGGYKINTDDAVAADVLINSEKAMLQSKRQGGGCYSIFHSDDGTSKDDVQSLLSKGADFMDAYLNERLKIAFQPVYNVENDEIAFYECLVRMVDLEGKLVPAASFIPVVEALGFSRYVDRFSARSAIYELITYPDIRLSVNVSNWSVIDREWLRSIVLMLRDRRDVAERLTIEITETIAMQNLKETKAILSTLKDLGCQIALDDFGAGYTSFKQLREFDFDVLKIDQDFVRNLSDPENLLFVKTLFELSEGLGIMCVAEGAETNADTQRLIDLGVKYIQGYAYAHPSLNRIWLKKNHPERCQLSA